MIQLIRTSSPQSQGFKMTVVHGGGRWPQSGHRPSQSENQSSKHTNCLENTWVMQPSQVITLLWVWMFRSTFGMVAEVKLMSTKDSLEKEKYMGVWRWKSELMARQRAGFQSDQVHGEEKPKYERLPYWFLWKYLKKFWNICCFLVPCGRCDYRKGDNSMTIFTKTDIAHSVEKLLFIFYLITFNYNCLTNFNILCILSL